MGKYGVRWVELGRSTMQLAAFATAKRRIIECLRSTVAVLSNRFIATDSRLNYRYTVDLRPCERLFRKTTVISDCQVCTPKGAHLLFKSRGIRLATRKLCVSVSAMSAEGEWKEFLNQEDAREMDNSLFSEYKFSIDQLMELAGMCVAQAVAQCYPLQELGVETPRVLLCCGPGNNGGDGLVAAKHLFFFGYEPVVFYPKRTSKEIYHILVVQCEKLNIPFIDKLPTAAELDSEYHVIVDALFGFSFKGTPRPPFDTVLATLKQVKKPLAAVDIPSGWDVEKGDVGGDGLRPNLLISLTAPKECAKFFTGQFHYLGLRVVPPALAAKFRIKLPRYPGTEQIVRLM